MINCPVCGLGNIVAEISEHTFEYKGEILTAQRTDGYCDSCGSEIIDANTARDNVRNIQHAKSAHDNLLSSKEIYAFRKKFNITQKTAASLFGGGESAFAKYESGDIAHNTSMDRLLRLTMANPHNIFDLAEIAKIQLDNEVVNSVFQFSPENFNELIGFSSSKLRFNKIKFSTQLHNAANDNSIEDVYHSIKSPSFEFKRTANL